MLLFIHLRTKKKVILLQSIDHTRLFVCLFVFSICETDVESLKLPNTRTQTLQITGTTCKYQILLLLSALLQFQRANGERCFIREQLALDFIQRWGRFSVTSAILLAHLQVQVFFFCVLEKKKMPSLSTCFSNHHLSSPRPSVYTCAFWCSGPKRRLHPSVLSILVQWTPTNTPKLLPCDTETSDNTKTFEYTQSHRVWKPTDARKRWRHVLIMNIWEKCFLKKCFGCSWKLHKKLLLFSPKYK